MKTTDLEDVSSILAAGLVGLVILSLTLLIFLVSLCVNLTMDLVRKLQSWERQGTLDGSVGPFGR